MFHCFHTGWDNSHQYLMKYQNAHKLRDSISTSFDARIFLVNIYIINNLIKQNKTIRVPFDGNLSFTRVHVIFKMVKKGRRTLGRTYH